TRVGMGTHVAGGEGGSDLLESGQVRFFELGKGGGQAPGGFRHPALQHHLVFAPLGEELPALEGPLGGDEDFFHVDGLGDEVIGPGLEAFDGRLDIAHPGDDDDGGVSVHRAGALEEFKAVHHGHPDVREGEGRALALEGLQALASVRRHLRLVAVGGEDFPEGVPALRVVLDDEPLPLHGELAHGPLVSAPMGCATPTSSWTETRFLPARLAAYSASSAARMRSSAVGATSSGREAMPKLAVMRRRWANCEEYSTWRMRSA